MVVLALAQPSKRIVIAHRGASGYLPEGDRHLILQRYFNGSSHAELAARRNLPEETVRRRVSRAVAKLRDLLARRGITTTASALGIHSLNSARVVKHAIGK